jgi:hypothetical protein
MFVAMFVLLGLKECESFLMMCFDVFVVVKGGRLFSDARCCRDGRAPVHVAASEGHLSCLEFLVGRNADVNAQTK